MKSNQCYFLLLLHGVSFTHLHILRCRRLRAVSREAGSRIGYHERAVVAQHGTAFGAKPRLFATVLTYRIIYGCAQFKFLLTYNKSLCEVKYHAGIHLEVGAVLPVLLPAHTVLVAQGPTPPTHRLPDAVLSAMSKGQAIAYTVMYLTTAPRIFSMKPAACSWPAEFAAAMFWSRSASNDLSS